MMLKLLTLSLFEATTALRISDKQSKIIKDHRQPKNPDFGKLRRGDVYSGNNLKQNAGLNPTPAMVAQLSGVGSWSGDISKGKVTYTPEHWTSPLELGSPEDACACLTSGYSRKFYLHYIGASHTRMLYGAMSNFLSNSNEDFLHKDSAVPEQFKEQCGGSKQYTNEAFCHDKLKITTEVCNGKVKLEFTEKWLPKHFDTAKLKPRIDAWKKEANQTGGNIGFILGSGSHFISADTPNNFHTIPDNTLTLIESIKPAFALWQTLPSQLCKEKKWAKQEPKIIAGNKAIREVLKKHPESSLLDTYAMTQGHCEFRTADHSHFQAPIQEIKTAIVLHSVCSA